MSATGRPRKTPYRSFSSSQAGEAKITALYERLSRDDKPGWCALTDAIADGKIGTIIVKDYSRLGRNLLKVGGLAEKEKDIGVLKEITKGGCAGPAADLQEKLKRIERTKG